MSLIVHSFVRLALAVWMVLFALAGNAEAPQTGPVVDDFGPAFPAPDTAFNLLPDRSYKVRLDVASGGDAETSNRALESAARYLNMHAQSGINVDNLRFALVVHGSATADLLTDSAFQARFGKPNPNSALLAALNEAGVDIYLCAQSAVYKGFAWEEFDPAVTIAVSAMTAHVRLESEGYGVIPF